MRAFVLVAVAVLGWSPPRSLVVRRAGESWPPPRSFVVRRAGESWEQPVRAPRPMRRKFKKARKRPQSTDSPGTGQRLLRVIAGEARGRRLDSPDTLLRPMMGKVREALFSTLVSLGVFRPPREVSVLDVFCGSGSVGIEALSRGAVFTAFVDLSRTACDVAVHNAENCGYGKDRCASVCDAAERVLARDEIAGHTFDVVSLTPPYEEVSYPDLLDTIAKNDRLLNDDAVLVVEYPIELGSLPPTLGEQMQLRGLRNRKYGRTAVAYYAARPTGKLPFDFRPSEFEDATWAKKKRGEP